MNQSIKTTLLSPGKLFTSRQLGETCKAQTKETKVGAFLYTTDILCLI